MIGPVRIESGTDGLVWRLVDRAFEPDADRIVLCEQFELDLFRARAEEAIEREHEERTRFEAWLQALQETRPVEESEVANTATEVIIP